MHRDFVLGKHSPADLVARPKLTRLIDIIHQGTNYFSSPAGAALVELFLIASCMQFLIINSDYFFSNQDYNAYQHLIRRLYVHSKRYGLFR